MGFRQPKNRKIEPKHRGLPNSGKGNGGRRFTELIDGNEGGAGLSTREGEDLARSLRNLNEEAMSAVDKGAQGRGVRLKSTVPLRHRSQEGE